jgi:hypothetical protein
MSGFCTQKLNKVSDYDDKLILKPKSQWKFLLKFLALKMAKIQGSDGLMGKRKIAILNIDSILNKCFLGQMRCQSACYNKFKMGLYVEFG